MSKGMSGKELRGAKRKDRKSSSDSETVKPPTKMAARDGNDEVKNMLRELKDGQKALRSSFDKSIDRLKKELLGAMDTKIEEVKEELSSEIGVLNKKYDDMEKRISDMEDHLNRADTGDGSSANQGEQFQAVQRTQPNKMVKMVKRLHYRSLDQEARSRRNNVLVFNLAEAEGEDVVHVVRSFIRDRLLVNTEVAIQRAHRLGRPKRDGKARPIIALLRDYPDVQQLFKNARNLKGTRYGLGRDYPEEIRRARARLEADRRKARGDKKRALIAYPAKLIVDDAVVRDEFPDWAALIRDDADEAGDGE